jgi:hypothetical protein
MIRTLVMLMLSDVDALLNGGECKGVTVEPVTDPNQKVLLLDIQMRLRDINADLR